MFGFLAFISPGFHGGPCSQLSYSVAERSWVVHKYAMRLVSFGDVFVTDHRPILVQEVFIGQIGLKHFGSGPPKRIVEILDLVRANTGDGINLFEGIKSEGEQAVPLFKDTFGYLGGENRSLAVTRIVFYTFDDFKCGLDAIKKADNPVRGTGCHFMFHATNIVARRLPDKRNAKVNSKFMSGGAHDYRFMV